MKTPTVDLSFPHCWEAEILSARPLILPPRHFVYPREAEEVERGALEVLVRPLDAVVKGTDFSSDIEKGEKERALLSPVIEKSGSAKDKQPQILRPHHASRGSAQDDSAELFLQQSIAPEGTPRQPPQPFLATCALGFRDPSVPTGLWSAPKSEELCAISGGYAYLIDTTAPERFTMIEYRPVLDVRPVVAMGLILFVGHHSILAWSREGEAWRSPKLSDEGVTITTIEDAVLHGLGWEMMTDKEAPFTLDLRSGQHR